MTHLLQGKGMHRSINASLADQEVVIYYGNMILGQLDIFSVLVQPKHAPKYQDIPNYDILAMNVRTEAGAPLPLRKKRLDWPQQ